MKFIEHIRFRMGRALAPSSLLLVLIYFAYHAVSGNYGLLALKDLNAELAETEARAEAVATERAVLEMRTNRLRPDNLDPELLDERARAALGFVRRDEAIIYRRNLDR